MFIVKEEDEKKQADIRIIGVGGAGNNMIETMINEGIKGVEFIAINTDHQALESSSAKKKIQIGSQLTKGLGAGANPEVGQRASVESYEEIVNCLKGADMVFVTAGMGGGTGTGAAPFIAQSAHELGILTVGIVTKPFMFEGYKRTKQAKRGVSELSQYVDTLIVVPNEKLLGLAEKNTPLLETFKLTDEVLLQAVKGISELVSVPGLINLDFADIKTVMRNKGMALMGRGCANRPNRVEKALKSAVSSPLLGGLSIQGATGIIVNVTADSSLSLTEFKQASSYITEMADPSADIIIGTVIDEDMEDQLSITVIATGFSNEFSQIDWEAMSIKDSSPDTGSQSLNDSSLKPPSASLEQEKRGIQNQEKEFALKEAGETSNQESKKDHTLNPQKNEDSLEEKKFIETTKESLESKSEFFSKDSTNLSDIDIKSEEKSSNLNSLKANELEENASNIKSEENSSNLNSLEANELEENASANQKKNLQTSTHWRRKLKPQLIKS